MSPYEELAAAQARAAELEATTRYLYGVVLTRSERIVALEAELAQVREDLYTARALADLH